MFQFLVKKAKRKVSRKKSHNVTLTTFGWVTGTLSNGPQTQRQTQAMDLKEERA